MKITKTEFSKKEKAHVVKLIEGFLPGFNRSRLTDQSYKDVVNLIYENIKVFRDTHVVKKLQLIVSFKFLAEILILLMVIETMAPELKPLGEKLKIAINI